MNQIAAQIVETVTGRAEVTKEAISRVAAELGRRGGLKGRQGVGGEAVGQEADGDR